MATGCPVPLAYSTSFYTPPTQIHALSPRIISLFTKLRCRKHGRTSKTVSLSLPTLRPSLRDLVPFQGTAFLPVPIHNRSLTVTERRLGMIITTVRLKSRLRTSTTLRISKRILLSRLRRCFKAPCRRIKDSFFDNVRAAQYGNWAP